MPAKSKAQQRFMGMVHAYKKGELKGSEVSKDVKDAAKGMKKKTAKDYAKTKHKGLPNKVKKEDLMRLIDKYGAKKVRETIMAVRPKAVTVSGNRMPEDPDFEYDPEKKTDEGFGGELKGKDKKKFEKARKENAEQLGYKVTGTSDTKKQTLKMANELNEGTCGYGIDGKLGDKPAGPHLLKARKKKKLEKEVSNPTSGIMMARKMSSLEMQQIILLAKAMKQLPGSPAQKKIKKQINVIRKKLGQAPVKESVNEAKANIYGIEFRKSPKDRKFKKASLTISSTQGLRAHRNMTMAILKKAEKLKKQSKWAEYRITVNGQPYMMGLGAKRITRFPRPKINDNIDIDEGFYDGTKKFEKNRKKNAEQLGYKVTGISDIKTDLQSTINEDDVVEEECCDNCHEGKECCSVHEAKETGIDVAKRVLKNKQYEKGPGWALDLTTAGFIMKIYNAYKSHPNLQRQMKNLPVKKMVNLAYKVMK